MKVCQWCGSGIGVYESEELNLCLCVNCWEEAVDIAHSSLSKSNNELEEEQYPHIHEHFFN